MSSGPLRVGLIGCGRLAEVGYLPALAGLTEVTLAAVADPDRARAVAVARAAPSGSVPAVHETAGELVSAGGLDALVISSPASEHVWQAELADHAGIPALVEKPPAIGFAGAERMAELSRPPWIGFNRRFQHGLAVRPDVPGEGPFELELELRYRRASWRALTVSDDALEDLGPHLIDLALWLTGSESASVASAALSAARAELELQTDRGPATIRCASDRAHRELVQVRAADRRVVARSSAGGPSALVSARLPGREHPLVSSLRDQLRAFAAAVRGERVDVLATAAEGARVMRVIDDARAVAGRGLAA